jgi:hypothetical protein
MVSNAFRSFNKACFLEILPLNDDFSISPQMVIKMKMAGMRIAETNVGHKERIHGKAKFSMVKHGPSYIAVLLKHYLHHSRNIDEPEI